MLSNIYLNLRGMLEKFKGNLETTHAKVEGGLRGNLV